MRVDNIPEVLSLRCPVCRGTLVSDSDKNLRCLACAEAVRVIGGVPVFPIRLDQMEAVVSSIRASHEYNFHASPDDHLKYTKHTLKVYKILRSIILNNYARAPKRIKVLDIGAGRGELCSLLSNEFEASMTDVDLYSCLLAKRNQRPDNEFLVFCSECSYLPLEDCSIDIVIVKETLHHLTNPHMLLCEVVRVLNPGGTAIIIEPVLGLLRNRSKAESLDAMREFGAIHQHLRLRELSETLRHSFERVRAARSVINMTSRILRKIGISLFSLDMFKNSISSLPIRLGNLITSMLGGSIIMVCQVPRLHNAGVPPSELGPYPIELASYLPLPGWLEKAIYDQLAHSDTR